MNDFNQTLIAEFRANGGKVSGGFAGSTLLLLNTIGAKSGHWPIRLMGIASSSLRPQMAHRPIPIGIIMS